MKTTPKIPTAFVAQRDIEIKSKNKDGEEKSVFWRNAFSEKLLGANIDRFYPTETLYGDWDGEVLFLAQDALPAPLLKKLIEDFRKRGIPVSETWVHGDKDNPNLKGFLDESIKAGGSRTNTNLKKFKEKFIDSKGAVYGSVAANMLFDDDGGTNMSQDVKGFNSPIFVEYMQTVLKWVVMNMPNLKVVFCLGVQACQVSSSFLDLDKKDRNKNFIGEPPKRAKIGTKEIDLIHCYHPTQFYHPKCAQKVERTWEYLRESLK